MTDGKFRLSIKALSTDSNGAGAAAAAPAEPPPPPPQEGDILRWCCSPHALEQHSRLDYASFIAIDTHSSPLIGCAESAKHSVL